MNMEDGFTFFKIRKFNMNLPVKPSCPHQRAVKNIGPVCCCQNNNTSIRGKTIHFGKQLIKCIFPFIIGTSHSISASCPANGINFINKNDTWSFFFSLFEQIADTGSAYAYKHFYEIGTGNRKERNFGFTGNCLSQQRFTCSRRSDQKCSLWNLTAKVSIFRRVFQKINNFHYFHFGLFQTRHVTKINGYGSIFIVKLRLGFTNVKKRSAAATAAATAHQTHDNKPCYYKKENGKYPT